MKKTVIVNINGIIFHIDEDAYGKLGGYIDALHRYFDAQAGGKEIVSDIESRIAELLQPRISEAKQSVTEADIEEIIATLGQPEDIAGTEDDEQTGKKQEQVLYTTPKYSRILYRDPDHKVLGGVCSGLAAYFDIDPILFRIIFIALFFAAGISILIYPVLWLAVPMAHTSAQKLEMRGEEVTVNTIEKTYRSAETASGRNKLGNFLNEVFHVFEKIFFACWRIFTLILGAFLIVASLSMIVALVAALFFNDFFWHDINHTFSISVQEFLHLFINPADTVALVIVLLVISLIPLILLIYTGLKLIIRFQAKDKAAILSLTIIWIAAVIAGSFLVFKQVNNYKYESFSRNYATLTVPKGKTIYLKISTLFPDSGKFQVNFFHEQLYGIRTSNNKKELYGPVRISIEKSSSTSPEIEIIRSARSASDEKAANLTRLVNVNYVMNDSVLTINPVFRISEGFSWNFQEARAILHIPVGTQIYLDEDIRPYLEYTSNVNDVWSDNMAGKLWTMTENGLELVSFSKTETISLKTPENNKLYLQLRDRFPVTDMNLFNKRHGRLQFEGKTYNYKVIRFNIKKNEENTITLQIQKKTAGQILGNRRETVNDLQYSFEQNDSILWLDPVFLFSPDTKNDDQEVQLNLCLPIDSKIFLSDQMKLFFERFSGNNQQNKEHLLNKNLKMTLDGLKEIN